ncbi:MAG: hypothetical protein GF388_10165 [Candidatus Aegiribacteria sp.]|nr:hypothetical protein [Candidatus Aegiribacteria sp.]MBD3295397.1 hypothetical protein [Candidatus Fermentibacteria bacterium]
MKVLFILVTPLLIAGLAVADITETYGWEGTDTILASYGDIDAEIATDPVHGGSQSLHLTDQAASGTPQAYIAWITGLVDGDEVTASFWRYDTTPGASPSCRIWGHWNDDPGDINGYNGSASGNSEYGPGTGWDETSYTWTVVDGHTGLVIECRTYSSPGDEVWIDDMTVTAPDGTTIILPGELALEAGTWADIKASF